MRNSLKIAFVCYALSLLAPLSFGLIYLFRPEFLPYHAVAIGQAWPEVKPEVQVLILALMRVVGASNLAVAFIGAVILIIPFRQGSVWARWAFPVMGLIAASGSFYATWYVQSNTGAATPWQIVLVAITLVALGLVFSLLHKQDA